MSVVHRVTGYDKQSERLEREKDIPPELVLYARGLADAAPDYQAAPGAFPLNDAAVRRMSGVLGYDMNPDRYDWFLEPVEK